MFGIHKQEVVEVLLITNNQEEAEHIVLTLKLSRFANTVLHVREGKAAMNFLFNEPLKLPKIILLDSQIKDLTAEEVIHRLKSTPRFSDIPIMVLVDENTPDNLIRLGYPGLTSLPKPFEFGKFIAKVSTIGFYLVIVKEPPSES